MSKRKLSAVFYVTQDLLFGEESRIPKLVPTPRPAELRPRIYDLTFASRLQSNLLFHQPPLSDALFCLSSRPLIPSDTLIVLVLQPNMPFLQDRVKPTPYPRLPFHSIRSAQLLSSTIVASIMIYFCSELARNKYKLPWTFILVRPPSHPPTPCQIIQSCTYILT